MGRFYIIIFSFCLLVWSCDNNSKVLLTSNDFSILDEHRIVIDGFHPDVEISGIDDSFEGKGQRAIRLHYTRQVPIEVFEVAVQDYMQRVMTDLRCGKTEVKEVTKTENNGSLVAKCSDIILKISYQKLSNFSFVCQLELERESGQEKEEGP